MSLFQIYFVATVFFIVASTVSTSPGLLRIHSKTFILGETETSHKRSIHSGASFHVYGIRTHGTSPTGGIEFVLRRHSSQPRVYVKGVEVNSMESQATVFTGHVKKDPNSIVVLTLKDNDLFKGMVHWSNGEHNHVKFNDILELGELRGNELDTAVDLSCSTESHIGSNSSSPDEHRFNPHGKRSVQSNGLSQTNGKTYTIKVAIETNSYYTSQFSSTSEARDYMMTVIGVVSAMYERDFNTKLSVVQLGLNSAGGGGASAMKNYAENEYPSLDFNVGVALRGGRGGGYAQRVGGLCDEYKFCEAGVSGTYGTDEFDAIHDPYIIAHEIGHLLGSEHTHDTKQYSPVIDSCGNGGQVPPDAGVCMSYCVTAQSSLNKSPCWSYCQLALVMGEVGKHGYKSERINQVIRAHIEDSETCAKLSFTTGSSTPPPTPSPTPEPVATEPPTVKSDDPSTTPTPSTTLSPTASPTPIPPHVLYDQRGSCTTDQFPAQYFPDNKGAGEAADDFRVPDGIKWRIKIVTIEGKWEPQNTNIDIDSVSVIIYKNKNGSPGDVACKEEDAQILAPETSDEMTLFLPKDDCVLNSGRYWLQVLPYVPFGDNMNQFYWRESSSSNGNKFHWRDTEDIFVKKLNPCLTWSEAQTCYYSPGPDLCFSLFGVTSEDTVLRPSESTSSHIGLGSVFFAALLMLM